MENLPIIKELKEELKRVERELKFELPAELRKAAAHGDFRENAEYDAAKQRQSFLEARAAHLRQRIGTLTSLKIENIPKDAVGFGSRVELEDLDTGKTVTYELVTPEELDPKKGKISPASPVGKAIMGRRTGDEVEVKLPSGVKEYLIKGFKTLHDLIFERNRESGCPEG